ncbi:MAG: hypothetical protein A4E65_00393 [Syntrophorhabdus sp. PtaU1.Bin153]|nr:MAG: hypothetical protein A4E65_00393 [Syntrophorhabdus sp. PtaU1.Bin153]
MVSYAQVSMNGQELHLRADVLKKGRLSGEERIFIE